MIKLLQGHVLEMLAGMPSKSVHCVVTSPPYYGLRSYGTEPVEWLAVSYPPMVGLPEIHLAGCEAGCQHVWGTEQKSTAGRNDGGRDIGGRGGNYQEGGPHKAETSQGQFCQRCGGWRGSLGNEPTIEMFVGHLVLIFRELKRVLRDDAVFFLNLGDSYASNSTGGAYSDKSTLGKWRYAPESGREYDNKKGDSSTVKRTIPTGLQAKNLLGIPWRVALALQADGWILRSDIIWAKNNPMPESVRDRPTKAHEYLFLLTKKKKYYYDQEAVRVRCTESGIKRQAHGRNNSWGDTRFADPRDERSAGINYAPDAFDTSRGRNRRTVWTLSSESYKGAHFATFPRSLVRPCILAGTSERGVCRICGAGWVRVVERKKDTRKTYKTVGAGNYADGAGRNDGTGGLNKVLREDGRGGDLATIQTKTLTWQPSCTCTDEQGNTPEPIPATVCDPFCGSGTTGVVAKEAGRDFIGIDLSAEYLELARQRINTAQPTFDDVPEPEQPTMEQLGF